MAVQYHKKQIDRTSGIARFSVRCSGVVERVRVPAFGSYVISYYQATQRPRAFELPLPYISIALTFFPSEDLPASRFNYDPQANMSNKLMDTEAGGEQTQYEGIHTYVEPHDKKYGQFSGTFSISLSIHLTASRALRIVITPSHNAYMATPQTLQKAHRSTQRRRTLAPQTHTALRLRTRFAMDRVSRRAAWGARPRVQAERRKLRRGLEALRR